MSAMLSADWRCIEKDIFFRKYEIYNMGWAKEISLENMMVAAAQFGGPIAVTRDRRQFVKIQGLGKPKISIYSASGQLFSSFVWSGGQLLEMGWSSGEELLCIQDDGQVLIYDIFGRHQHTFGIGQEAKEFKVIEAKIFNSDHVTGIAVMTSMYRVYLVNNVKDPRVRHLAEVPSLNKLPNCWAVLSEDRQTKVLLAEGNHLHILMSGQRSPQVATEFGGKIVNIAVSYNNHHVALLSENGSLWIGSADVRKKFIEIFKKFPVQLKQFVWCGTDGILGLVEDSDSDTSNLLLVGRHTPNLEWINYSNDSTVHLVPEIDGIRILSKTVQEVLQRVPPVVQGIFSISSTEPAAYLLEASKHFLKRSHRADQYILLVKPHLKEAVQQCIEAAGHEFEINSQKILIRAAQYGKGFLQDVFADEYVRMCRTLRVLNAVRDPRIGIPITITQLQCLTVQGLLNRLVVRHHYYLAILIAKYLRLPETEGSSRILANWACNKVKQVYLDSDIVAREIADKLGYLPGISYSKIAEKAAQCGHTDLAIKLMDYEPKASLQVPLLLQLEQYCPALLKAIESGDTDLVYTVLLHLHKRMSLDQFQLAIRGFPMAQALYIKYCREQGQDTIRAIYNQEDDFLSQAVCSIQECYDPKNVASPEASLYSAVEAFKRVHCDALSTLCQDQLRLLGHQKNLESKFGHAFVNLSLHDTVAHLLRLGQFKLADKLRTEYKVPDRRFWWLKVLSLAELGEWMELEKFSKSKKSPIGYEPFVDVCLQKEKVLEAQKYLPKVKDEVKVKYYIKSGLYEDAVQFAYEQKDYDALLFIQSKCPASNITLIEKINSYVLQINSKK